MIWPRLQLVGFYLNNSTTKQTQPVSSRLLININCRNRGSILGRLYNLTAALHIVALFYSVSIINKVRNKSSINSVDNDNRREIYTCGSDRRRVCGQVKLWVLVSCSHWPAGPTHIALAEVHRHLALVPELAVHGCPHQQVRQAVLVQINCTQWGAKVRAHLEPSRATEQWVRSQTRLLQVIHYTWLTDFFPLSYISIYIHLILKSPWFHLIYSGWNASAISLALVSAKCVASLTGCYCLYHLNEI